MRIIIVLAILVLIVSCTKSDNEFEKVTIPSLECEKIIDSLMVAYNTQSNDKLKTILDNWNASVNGYALSELEDDKTRDVYEIFIEIYTPFDISRLGNHEWGGHMYEGFEYVIVQNKVFFDYTYETSKFTFESPEPEEIDTVTDFRPQVYFDNAKTLYLTEEYEVALNVFLDSDFFPFEAYDIEKPSLSWEESYKRLQFLITYLAIIPGHWGKYWHIETHPHILNIHFDAMMEKARVLFRVGYMFGTAELEKQNGDWVLISSVINMIE